MWHEPFDATVKNREQLSRRDFLKTGATVSGALVVGFMMPVGLRRVVAQEAAKTLPLSPNAFVRIAADNTVTILLKHSEMGQGVWTSLPMVLAEELDCDWNNVRAEHAPAAQAYVHTAFGIQMTGGSTSTWESFEQLRKAGATARALLLQAAAQKWNTQLADCRTEKGFVVCASHRASYGELSEAAALLPPPNDVKLKDSREFTLIGRPIRRLDSKPKCNGTAEFGIDVKRPNMLIAVVARAPVFGAKMKSFDASKAKSTPGVVDVVQVPSGVAVLGKHFWAAKTGRDALAVEWDLGDGASLSTVSLRADYRKLAQSKGVVAKTAGDPDAAMKGSHVIEAEYEVPFLAHAPMEPLNCTVEIGKDGCDIYTGTQFQTMDQNLSAKILGLKPEQVRIHTTFLGGGFGRRANPSSDFADRSGRSGESVRQDGQGRLDARGRHPRRLLPSDVAIASQRRTGRGRQAGGVETHRGRTGQSSPGRRLPQR